MCNDLSAAVVLELSWSRLERTARFIEEWVWRMGRELFLQGLDEIGGQLAKAAVGETCWTTLLELKATEALHVVEQSYNFLSDLGDAVILLHQTKGIKGLGPCDTVDACLFGRFRLKSLVVSPFMHLEEKVLGIDSGAVVKFSVYASVHEVFEHCNIGSKASALSLGMVFVKLLTLLRTVGDD